MRRLIVVGCLWMLLAQAGTCQTPRLKVAKTVLPNGLTVLALEDHTVPSVAYYTHFRVGSRNERPGITGLSHLFEHMMFNGSARFKPKEFDRLIESGGGYSNAGTTTDSTEYQEEFSTSTLDTVLQLEADRMRALRIDTQNLEQERGIVKEERRSSVDNSVEGSMSELLWNNAFVAHPYRWEVVGFMKDIDAIRLEDAKEYFRIHYAPNNAVVTVVGDFDTKKLFAAMRRYFAGIPRQPLPRAVVNSEPPQTGEKRISYHRAAELPAVTFAYKIGSEKDPDEPALELLAVILSGGESSRLHKSLVYDRQIATGVSASNQSRIDPGLFVFYAQAQPGHTAAECEQAIYDVLDDIKKNGVTERELQKAKNGVRVAFLDGFETNLGRASLISGFQADWGDWRRLYEYLPKRDKVTVADIQRVAKRYFTDRARTVVTLVPEKPDGAVAGRAAE